MYSIVKNENREGLNMEIKRINNSSNSYPKKEDITEEIINENMLDKWIIIGLSSLIMYGLLDSVSYGVDNMETQLAGDIAVIDENIIENTNSEYIGGETENYQKSPDYDVPEGQGNNVLFIAIAVVLVALVSIYVYWGKSRYKVKENEGEE